ncbi:MAG TPA: SGNH/GDSL hydrolase family protein [Candidatus Wallbacteria bacterium]|nr:MAG: GDSL-like Lipase/Acylhydrolase [bacterium ADurb.Bin243]HPG57151.1 SGNH/GDSL hydrolase family protein [Candidatus Wallbacteria bacterium]
MKKNKVKVAIVFYLLLAFLLLAISETGFYLLEKYSFQIRKSLNLISSQQAQLEKYKTYEGSKDGLWRLQPGYSLTLSQLINEKAESGHSLAVKSLNDLKSKYNLSSDEILIRINSSGFRGTEIDYSPSCRKILAIGDSCTFGTAIEKFTYPSVMEKELKRAGKEVKVINGGIEGYSPKNVLSYIDSYTRIKPEIVVIYIGWNALYAEKFLKGAEKYSHTVSFLKRIFNKRKAIDLFAKPKFYETQSVELKEYENYVPGFMDDVEKIIANMKTVSKTIFIVTLPGLYITGEVPSEKAMKKGHLPEYTSNPMVLAKITERYNNELRLLAEKEHVQLIDLHEWSLKTLRPREAYFNDSVHLTEEGQEMIGKHLAEVICEAIK